MSATPSNTPPTSSGAKEEAQSSPLLYLIVIAVFCVYWISQCASKEKVSETPNAPIAQSRTVTIPETGTVLMVDRSTPMADSINYQFEFDTQGDSVLVVYKRGGAERSVKYLGKGTLDLGQRDAGLVHITSLTPGAEARVRIWRVVKIYLP